jgi:hypothetical protein
MCNERLFIRIAGLMIAMFGYFFRSDSAKATVHPSNPCVNYNTSMCSDGITTLYHFSGCNSNCFDIGGTNTSTVLSDLASKCLVCSGESVESLAATGSGEFSCYDNTFDGVGGYTSIFLDNCGPMNGVSTCPDFGNCYDGLGCKYLGDMACGVMTGMACDTSRYASAAAAKNALNAACNNMFTNCVNPCPVMPTGYICY